MWTNESLRDLSLKRITDGSFLLLRVAAFHDYVSKFSVFEWSCYGYTMWQSIIQLALSAEYDRMS